MRPATRVGTRRGGLVLTIVWVGIGVQAAAAEPSPKGWPPLVLLAPGTVVGDGPPPGWSDLVVKAVPRLASGDLQTLPGLARRTATLFRTVIVADVRRARGTSGDYRIQRVGLGLCMPLSGADRVASSSENRDGLGMVERQVLSAAEDELRKGRILTATPTFVLFAAPTLQLWGVEHVKVLVLYGLLLDPTTGQLTRVVWSIPRTTTTRPWTTVVHVLAPSLVYDCGLDVAAQRILGTIPKGWSFAMRNLPPGKSLRGDGAFTSWAETPRRIVQDPAGFEARLRQVVFGRATTPGSAGGPPRLRLSAARPGTGG